MTSPLSTWSLEMEKEAKKPLNKKRRMQKIMKKDAPKKRSPIPPPGFSHKDKKKQLNRQKDKFQLKKEYLGSMVAKELGSIAVLLS